MRRTGRFRAREEYQDLFGAGTYERKGDLTIALERTSQGIVLNRLRGDKDAIISKYFEFEYEWADGKLVFLSDRCPFSPVYYIKDYGVEALIHSTYLSHAVECADGGKHSHFYDTKQDAQKVLINAIQKG